jgi:SAM-dependent methyltransferase
MSWISRALEVPAVYRLWQATHNSEKLAFIRGSMALPSAGRVLELGCGPAINAHLFEGCAYTGIDVNPLYIATARKRHPEHTFICADLLEYDFGSTSYDWVLINSFLHHVDDQAARNILAVVAGIPAARVVMIELVVPDHGPLARLLTALDRGKYPRRVSEWRALIPARMRIVTEAPIFIRRGGILLYHLIGYVLTSAALDDRPRHPG